MTLYLSVKNTNFLWITYTCFAIKQFCLGKKSLNEVEFSQIDTPDVAQPVYTVIIFSIFVNATYRKRNKLTVVLNI